MRQPTSSPVSDMIDDDEHVVEQTSLSVRPTSTADRDIGSDRNRSMMPFCMSSARPAPVIVAPKMTVCAKMPGHQELAVADARAASIALPKT